MESSKKLNLNQEAIIRKYQNEGIKIETPFDPSKRYIPTPEVLMNNIVIYKILIKYEYEYEYEYEYD